MKTTCSKAFKINPWRVHVKKIMREHPNLSLKEQLKLASKSYKK